MYVDYFAFPFWVDVLTIFGIFALYMQGNANDDKIDKLALRVRNIEPRVMKKVHKAQNRARVQAKANAAK